LSLTWNSKSKLVAPVCSVCSSGDVLRASPAMAPRWAPILNFRRWAQKQLSSNPPIWSPIFNGLVNLLGQPWLRGGSEIASRTPLSPQRPEEQSPPPLQRLYRSRREKQQGRQTKRIWSPIIKMFYNLYIYKFIHVEYNMENNVCYWVKFQIFIIWKLKFYNCSNMLCSIIYCYNYEILISKRWRFET
jgi:hypothetical protein